MVAKAAKMSCKSSLGSVGQVMASNKSDARAKGMQVTLPQFDNKDNAKHIEVVNLFSDLFDSEV